MVTATYAALKRDGEKVKALSKHSSDEYKEYIMAGLLADSCKKLGVRMTLRTLEWATFIQDYKVRNFDAAVLFHSWSDPFIDNYPEFHSSQDVPNGGNAMGWHELGPTAGSHELVLAPPSCMHQPSGRTRCTPVSSQDMWCWTWSSTR